MKRLFPIVLIAIVFLMSALIPAYADVVWSNAFLEQNRNKTIQVDRRFYANGPRGHINLLEKPGIGKVMATYENGKHITIGHAYRHMGKYWGIPPVDHTSGTMGWVPMDQLLLFYDNIDFLNDHRDEVHDFNGSLDFLLEADSFYLWRWPGSDREKRFFDSSEWHPDDSDVAGRYLYIDSEGREWVYVLIWWGIEPAPPGGHPATGWVCSDDPGNGRIPAFNPAPEPVIWSPPEGSIIIDGQPEDFRISEEQRESEAPGFLVFIVFAAAIAVVIVSIIVLLIRKNRYR